AMLKSLEGNDAEAIKILTELTNSDPAYYPAFHHLGYLFLKAGEPGKAADLFEKALQIDPTREWTHYYLSSAYLQLNRPLDAANQLWQSVRLAPRNKTFLERLLWVYKQNEMTCFEQQVLRLEQMTATGEAIDFAKEYSRIAQQCH
nr:tetratricopeptide repeat protein [Caldilineaceae bacterium]